MSTSTETTKSNRRAVIITTLVCLGIVLSSLYVLVLNYNLKAFTVMFCVYVLAYAAYLLACLLIFKKKLTGDFRYEVALYVTIFTLFFVLCLAILTVVLHQTKKEPVIRDYYYR